MSVTLSILYSKKLMKSKNCNLCEKETPIAYRVKLKPWKVWIFVCGKCCLKSKKWAYYIYGGTWKAKT